MRVFFDLFCRRIVFYGESAISASAQQHIEHIPCVHRCREDLAVFPGDCRYSAAFHKNGQRCVAVAVETFSDPAAVPAVAVNEILDGAGVRYIALPAAAHQQLGAGMFCLFQYEAPDRSVHRGAAEEA